MYRIMLYCKLFRCDRYDTDDILDMDDELVGRIRTQRTAVLNGYSTDELRELCSAVKFLANIFVSVGAPANTTNTLLSTGPSGALRAWQAYSYDVPADEIDMDFLFEEIDEPLFFEGYFSLPLETIFSERGITPPPAGDPASKWILDQVTSATDTCSQCAAPRGVDLYTEANWDRLPIPLMTFLKNHLRRNQTLSQPFYAVTSHLMHSDALGPFIGDLFAFKTHTAPGFDDWERTDLYCLPCLTHFLEEHLWIWFLEERLRGAYFLLFILCRISRLTCVRVIGGWVPPENCWYGWNCRTQTHKRSHAETKNHLCVPIKGDPA
ncbi:hypothetical protein B0H12DRAFT_157731 [Mycena haematopus]|nr:hypothetical protein B0H12DRAFT_157731 [Mycena haematopus]